MSRFYRSFTPFFRAVSNASRPATVAFGVAAAVPNNSDAPDYVQDVFKEFGSTYEHRKNDTYQQQVGLDHVSHEHASKEMVAEVSEPVESVAAEMTQTEALNLVQEALTEQTEEQMTSEEEEAKSF